jgi:hypothetical protein
MGSFDLERRIQRDRGAYGVEVEREELVNVPLVPVRIEDDEEVRLVR